VSPPATENAEWKLLAPKTTTGPTGRNIDLTSASETACELESPQSIRAYPRAFFNQSANQQLIAGPGVSFI
jgi:hypothetical protein